MKFLCDRCKTRYSIADERVRGKILKIRCKNCDAVITVREGMDDSGAPRQQGTDKAATTGAATTGAASPPRIPADARRKPKATAKATAKPAANGRPGSGPPRASSPPVPATPSGPSPVLAGAFAKALQRSADEPGAFDDSERTSIAATPEPEGPSHLEEEWFVSYEGEQSGPFDLPRAKAWIAARSIDDELYCWSEGFDEWLLVDKVSHFRNSRSSGGSAAGPLPAAPSPAPAMQAAQEDTPQPLFAATMAAVEADADPSVGDLAKNATDEAKANGNGTDVLVGVADDSESGRFDFDVGEASRIVRLPAIAAALRGGAAAASASPGLAGPARVGSGSGGHGALRQTGPVVVPLAEDGQPIPMPEVLPPKKKSVRWPLMAAALLLAVVVGVMLYVVASSGDDATTASVRRNNGNYETLGFQQDPRTIRVEIEKPVATGKSDTSARRGGTRTTPRAGNNGGSNSAGGDTSGTGKTDDFEFGRTGSGGPLSGDDLMNAYQENRLAIRMCYERALKQDPLLDVGKIYVDMTVAPSGSVTKVTLSDYSSTLLGSCLSARLQRWRFRKSSEVFTGRFPLVFSK